MDANKINKLNDKIRANREKLKLETGNTKNQRILRLEIEISELQIQIEKIKWVKDEVHLLIPSYASVKSKNLNRQSIKGLKRPWLIVY